MSESKSPSLPSPADNFPDSKVDKQTGAQSARMILATSFGLFAIYAVIVCFDSFPLRLLDPLWIITTSSSLANSVSLPLAGVGLTHIAAALAPVDITIFQRRRFISRLSALAALGFLLIMPLLGFATWRGISNVKQGAKLQAVAVNRAEAKLFEAIDQASSPQDLQKRMVALQGPPINDRDLVRPLAELKQTQKKIIKQVVLNIINQIPSPTSETYKPLYMQALRTLSIALVSSLSFAALAYDPIKQQTLLQRLFRRNSSLNKGPRGFGQILKALPKSLTSPFKQTSSEEAEKSRIASEIRRKAQQAAAARTRDMKRNAEKQRKLQIELEKKRRQDERESLKRKERNK